MKIKIKSNDNSLPAKVQIRLRSQAPRDQYRAVAQANAESAKVPNCDGIFVRQS